MDLPPQEMTATEFFGTLTGFEEMAIKKQFRSDIYDLGDHDRSMFLRSLLFVAVKRQGEKDADAFRIAMEAPQKTAVDYFPDPPKSDPEGDDDDLGEGSGTP